MPKAFLRIHDDNVGVWVETICKGGWKIRDYNNNGWITITENNTKLRNSSNTGWIDLWCPEEEIPEPLPEEPEEEEEEEGELGGKVCGDPNSVDQLTGKKLSDAQNTLLLGVSSDQGVWRYVPFNNGFGKNTDSMLNALARVIVDDTGTKWKYNPSKSITWFHVKTTIARWDSDLKSWVGWPQLTSEGREYAIYYTNPSSDSGCIHVTTNPSYIFDPKNTFDDRRTPTGFATINSNNNCNNDWHGSRAGYTWYTLYLDEGQCSPGSIAVYKNWDLSTQPPRDITIADLNNRNYL